MLTLTADFSKRNEDDCLPLDAAPTKACLQLGQYVDLQDDDMIVEAKVVRRNNTDKVFLLDWDTVEFKAWAKRVR